jgi:hypothetical protein
MTECKRDLAGSKGRGGCAEQVVFDFGGGARPTLRFDAGAVTSDAGLAVLRQADERLGLFAAAAGTIEDRRWARMVVHPVQRLLREVVYAYAAGYEDGNDHPRLAADELFSAMIGPAAAGSINPKQHTGLASEATISRLLGARVLACDALEAVHRRWFLLSMCRRQPPVLTLDIDGYDAETHGQQQLSMYNDYYGQYMYYPLQISVAEYGFVVGALLRPGDAASNGQAAAQLRPLLEFLGKSFPKTRLRLRADSGFMDPEIYDLCEEFSVEYAVRLKMNKTLKALIQRLLEPRVEREVPADRRDRRWALYAEHPYRAGTWHRSRRVLLKLTFNPAKDRVESYALVTNSARSQRHVWGFYEHRGQCEQRIDELKNHLRAEKFSCTLFESNAVKLHLMVMAHNLFAAVRMLLPARHELKRATIGQLRVRLIKCGATLRRTARRLWIHASSSWPFRGLLADVAVRMVHGPLRPVPLWNSG